MTRIPGSTPFLDMMDEIENLNSPVALTPQPSGQPFGQPSGQGSFLDMMDEIENMNYVPRATQQEPPPSLEEPEPLRGESLPFSGVPGKVWQGVIDDQPGQFMGPSFVSEEDAEFLHDDIMSRSQPPRTREEAAEPTLTDMNTQEEQDAYQEMRAEEDARVADGQITREELQSENVMIEEEKRREAGEKYIAMSALLYPEAEKGYIPGPRAFEKKMQRTLPAASVLKLQGILKDMYSSKDPNSALKANDSDDQETARLRRMTAADPKAAEDLMRQAWVAADVKEGKTSIFTDSAYAREFFGGIQQTAIGFRALAAQALHGDIAAGYEYRNSETKRIINSDLAKDDLAPYLARIWGGAVQSIGTMSVGAAVAGPYGAVTLFTLEAGSGANYEGMKSGLKGVELGSFVALEMAIEGGIQAITVGSGKGLIKMFAGKGGVKKVFKDGWIKGMKEVAKTHIPVELLQELTTEFAHIGAKTAFDVEGGLDLEGDIFSEENQSLIINTLLDTVSTTLMTFGVLGGASSTIAYVKDPSRANFKNLPGGMRTISAEDAKNRRKREAAAEKIRNSQHLKGAKNILAVWTEMKSLDPDNPDRQSWMRSLGGFARSVFTTRPGEADPRGEDLFTLRPGEADQQGVAPEVQPPADEVSPVPEGEDPFTLRPGEADQQGVAPEVRPPTDEATTEVPMADVTPESLDEKARELGYDNDEKARELGYDNVRQLMMQNVTKDRSEVSEEVYAVMEADAKRTQQALRATPEEAAKLDDHLFKKWEEVNYPTLDDTGWITARGDNALGASRMIQAMRARGENDRADSLLKKLKGSHTKADWTVESWQERFDETLTQEEIDGHNQSRQEYNETLDGILKRLGPKPAPVKKPTPEPAPTEAQVEAGAKEPWEMTRKEFTEAYGSGDNWSSVVRRNLDQGEDIPKAVQEELAAHDAAKPKKPADTSLPSAKVGDTVVRFTHADGTGLLNNSGLDRSKLTDDEENELVLLMDLGLLQPASGTTGIFYFTKEGEKKHKRMLELLSKASKSGVVRTESTLGSEPTWESTDGQLAAKPTSKDIVPSKAPTKPEAPVKKPTPAPDSIVRPLDAQINEISDKLGSMVEDVMEAPVPEDIRGNVLSAWGRIRRVMGEQGGTEASILDPATPSDFESLRNDVALIKYVHDRAVSGVGLEFTDSDSMDSIAYEVEQLARKKTVLEFLAPVKKPTPKPTETKAEAESTLPPMRDNYRKKLSEYTPTLYREVGISDLFLYLKDAYVSSDMSPSDVYFSNDPELALGQGDNVGVLMEFDSGEIEGIVNKSKPAWKVSYSSGQAEFVGRRNPQSIYQDALRSFTLKPDVKGSRSDHVRLKKLILGRLHESGWVETKNQDGSVTYTKPKGVAPKVPKAAKPKTAPKPAPTEAKAEGKPSDATTLLGSEGTPVRGESRAARKSAGLNRVADQDNPEEYSKDAAKKLRPDDVGVETPFGMSKGHVDVIKDFHDSETWKARPGSKLQIGTLGDIILNPRLRKALENVLDVPVFLAKDPAKNVESVVDGGEVMAAFVVADKGPDYVVFTSGTKGESLEHISDAILEEAAHALQKSKGQTLPSRLLDLESGEYSSNRIERVAKRLVRVLKRSKPAPTEAKAKPAPEVPKAEKRPIKRTIDKAWEEIKDGDYVPTGQDQTRVEDTIKMAYEEGLIKTRDDVKTIVLENPKTIPDGNKVLEKLRKEKAAAEGEKEKALQDTGDKPSTFKQISEEIEHRAHSIENISKSMDISMDEAAAVDALARAGGLDTSKIFWGRYEGETETSPGRTSAKGTILIWAGKVLIVGFQSSDISTAIHELSHVVRRQILNRRLPENQRGGITDAELTMLEKWAWKDTGKNTWKDNVPAEERFARALELYLRTGKVHVAGLDKVFEKISKWLQGIYKNVFDPLSPLNKYSFQNEAGETVSLEVKASPEVEALFEKILSRGDPTAGVTVPPVTKTPPKKPGKPPEKKPVEFEKPLHEYKTARDAQAAYPPTKVSGINNEDTGGPLVEGIEVSSDIDSIDKELTKDKQMRDKMDNVLNCMGGG